MVRNPIPCFGQGNNVQGNGTQFPLPTLRGKPARTPTPLAGFCPCRKNNNGHSGHDAAASVKPAWVAGAAARTCYCCCGCCAANRPEPSFDDWIIVDRLRVPANLPTGEYARGFAGIASNRRRFGSSVLPSTSRAPVLAAAVMIPFRHLLRASLRRSVATLATHVACVLTRTRAHACSGPR